MDVEYREGEGRCGVAKRDVKQGEIILQEEATLVWQQGSDELINLVKAYKSASQHCRALIDSLSIKIAAESEELNQIIGSWTATLESSDLGATNLKDAEYISLLTRAHFNAHAIDDGRACFFVKAAMINHSCAPNSMYRFDGTTVSYWASKDLQKGEEITASYLEAMVMIQPTAYRRKTLLKSKAFICGCTRCTAAEEDTTRCQRCIEPACDGTVSPDNSAPESDTVPSWTCAHKCILTPEQVSSMEATEATLYRKWQALDARLAIGKTVSTQDVMDAIEACATRLHSDNFVTQLCRVLLIEVGVSTQDPRLLLYHAFTYAFWLWNTFKDCVPSNLLGTMTGSLAELFDRKNGMIKHGLDVDRVLSIIRTVLPYAHMRHGNEAAYPQALERVLQRYRTCASVICSNTGKLARCGRCNSVSYCSRSCQVFHYKSGGHKSECREIVESRACIEAIAVA